MASINYSKLAAQRISVRSISLNQSGVVQLGDKGRGRVRFIPEPPYTDAVKAQMHALKQEAFDSGILVPIICYDLPESDIEYL